MVKFAEATKRLFGNVFVCKRCKTKLKTSSLKVIKQQVMCRRCGSKSFRAIKKAKGKQTS